MEMDAKTKPRVKIYTRTGCPYCKVALDILKYHEIRYEEVDIYGPDERTLRDEIAGLTGGRSDVPQIFIDGKHIGDDDDLAEWEKDGKLNPLKADA